MQLNVWSTMLVLVLCREREGLDNLARVMQTKHVCLRLNSNPGNRIPKPQIPKDVHGIGADLNARTDLAHCKRG